MFEVCFGLGEMHEAQSDLPVTIHGSENLQREIKLVLNEYGNRFFRQVRREPAALPPFELRLTKTEKWSSSRSNCGRPRPLGPEKHKALKDQVEAMQAVDVIEQSTALHYSQAHLVPKKPRGWRFALDYRELNENSESYAWPIPNIREMFARIGEHRPRYFAVLDLTSGYHQVEVANPARALTAFITTMGIFQFKRLPMGLKGAPAYFQKMMSGIVLQGLVFSICEIYLDDCLVFGKTEEELVENLRQVLARFRQYNLTCNPDKCRFGMTQVEYVGVQIDENGLSFSKEKKESVMNFPQPEIQKQLKSF